MSQTFTMKNSLKELLEQAGPGMSLFLPEALLAFIPEEKQTIPLEEWADTFRMPWGLPFPAADYVQDANMLTHSDQYWDIVPLWDKEHFTIESNDIHSVSLMIPKCTLDGVRPAALICPGGGYENISFHGEGLVTAWRLEKAGYRTFILNYRYSPNRYPAPQLDLALAIKYLRANAAELQINPDDLMILGYSAGGHLCASTAALREELEGALQQELEKHRPDLLESCRGISIRPDKVCLCYPVISFLAEDHEPSFQARTTPWCHPATLPAWLRHWKRRRSPTGSACIRRVSTAAPSEPEPLPRDGWTRCWTSSPEEIRVTLSCRICD